MRIPRPPYCISNDAHNCWECYLSNYGRDCVNRVITHTEADVFDDIDDDVIDWDKLRRKTKSREADNEQD